jgi:hypothetical protein
LIGSEQPFRTTMQGVDVDVLVLPEAVRAWSNARPFLPPLRPMEIRGLAKRAALDELMRVGARSGQRWRVIIGDHVSTRRIDAVRPLL